MAMWLSSAMIVIEIGWEKRRGRLQFWGQPPGVQQKTTDASD
jgi:hypothetical protein